jgi:hypothetical protein
MPAKKMINKIIRSAPIYYKYSKTLLNLPSTLYYLLKIMKALKAMDFKNNLKILKIILTPWKPQANLLLLKNCSTLSKYRIKKKIITPMLLMSLISIINYWFSRNSNKLIIYLLNLL